MLRVDFHHQENTTTMKIEGRLVGDFAEDLRGVVASKKISGTMVVDLSGVTWVDSNGLELLHWLARLGCSFVVGNAYTSYVCEKLNLRVMKESVAKSV